jgi:hypothetical protein
MAKTEEAFCSFSHPEKWKTIFDTIIKKLGPEFQEWSRVSFEGEEMILHHCDGKRKVRVELHGIAIYHPSVAGGWLTALRERKSGGEK